jgi:DNA-binding transcriptional LysR family regulator
VLADTGSFTAAAERIGVSKAAMSEHIRELERAAGMALVRRTTRSVRLTEAGEQLVGATQGAFEQIERGLADIRELADTPRGLLRITAPVALGRQQIAPLVPVFLRRHPEVRIALELSERLSSLAQEGFDLAIRQAATVPETHVARDAEGWLRTEAGDRGRLIGAGAFRGRPPLDTRRRTFIVEKRRRNAGPPAGAGPAAGASAGCTQLSRRSSPSSAG